MQAQKNIKGTIWEVKGIYKTPDYKVTETDSVKSIIYKGLPYQGHDQQVFAYYSTPGMLSGDMSRDQQLTGIVLVHGGGDTAFKEWVLKWAQKGHAAIAMDLRGNDSDKIPLKYGFREPNRKTPYFKITANITDQWMF